MKPMKRGRVPKGFLSSNTAYMLVYKKLTIDCQISAMKKMKLKKPDTEVSASEDAVDSENVKGISQATDEVNEVKGKNGVEEVPLVEEITPEKKSKPGKNGVEEISLVEETSLEKKSKPGKNGIEEISLVEEISPVKKSEPDSEEKIERNESLVSENVDTSHVDRNIIIETILGTEECHKNDAASQQLQNKILSLKKPMVKIVKLDYRRLNGAAHRAMSCGERDFYEEVNSSDAGVRVYVACVHIVIKF